MSESEYEGGNEAGVTARECEVVRAGGLRGILEQGPQQGGGGNKVRSRGEILAKGRRHLWPLTWH